MDSFTTKAVKGAMSGLDMLKTYTMSEAQKAKSGFSAIGKVAKNAGNKPFDISGIYK